MNPFEKALNVEKNSIGVRTRIKKRKRVGRGPGSTFGKTCGKGHKGQKARSGNGIIIGFEGGQMPLHRRLPKRGFTNINRVEYQIVNLKTIAACKKLNTAKLVNPEALFKAGLISNLKKPVKILGEGDLAISVKIQANKFSSSAKEKVAKVGGETIQI